MRGKWVEVDHDRLTRTLEQFEAIGRRAADEGLSFGEAMRPLAGAGITGDGSADAAVSDWSETVAGPWLAETLAKLRHPDGLARADPGKSLQGTLRPYQQAGVQWLYLLTRLRLGACLADDMGLGKTIQVLSLLLVLRGESRHTRKPSLVVAPTSLLANWALLSSYFCTVHLTRAQGKVSAEARGKRVISGRYVLARRETGLSRRPGKAVDQN